MVFRIPSCVEGVPFEVAARQIDGFPHSIGQLVSHMNYWMDYELRRIRGGKPKYPEHNSESFPPAPSPADAEDWDILKKCFATLLQEFAALANSSAQEMRQQIESVHPGDRKIAGTLEAVLWQMVAHNSYHTGQIAMMRRSLRAWPPLDGGDTW